MLLRAAENIRPAETEGGAEPGPAASRLIQSGPALKQLENIRPAAP